MIWICVKVERNSNYRNIIYKNTVLIYFFVHFAQMQIDIDPHQKGADLGAVQVSPESV